MKKHILLVEYDTPTIELIQEVLSSPIFVIDLADEGEKAKELVKKRKYDLVITAAMLPKFHGFNLSQYIGTASPHTKIIIISGIYKGIEYKHQAITQYKADDFIEKPIQREVIKKRILDLLDLSDEDLKSDAKSPATKVPLTDTAKIPAVSKTQEEKNKYSSSDLFGDIIEEVEKIPSYEIKMEAPAEKEPEAKKTIPQPPPAPPDHHLENKIESELASLLKEKKELPDAKKFKKIEDDISKKLEDTLSGLGIKSKAPGKKPAAEKVPKSKPVAEPEKTETAKEHKKDIPAGKSPKKQTDELGNYDILGLIARGGMAEIYKAKRKGVKGFEKIIAIKKILAGYGEDDKYIEMFVDEAKIAAELSHPNIVQIYDLGKKDDYYFIAMEYVQGKDLRLILNKLAEQDRWIPEELSVYLVINVLEALGYAHSAKDNQGQNLEIVHRDISPPNILLSLNGDIKITDFGVSKASIKIHQTISGALKGKLLYMSPEQAKGEKNIDHRSDLYSVGVLLFELITRKKLFMDNSEMGVLKKVQNGKIINPSEVVKDINRELERIILKSLSKEREERYQSASEMIDDLEAYLKNHFDHQPTSLHVAHFLYGLFEKEFEKESIKVDLKPIPFEIKRKLPKKEQPKPESPESPESFDKEETESEEEELLLQEDRVVEEPKSEPEEKPEESKKEEEKFTPTIEIDFEKPKPIKEYQKPGTGVPPTLPEPDSEAEKKIFRPSFIEFDSLDKKKEKKRKKFLFFSILVIFIAVVAAGYYFLYYHPATSPSETVSNNPASASTPEFKHPSAAESESMGQPFEAVTPPKDDLTDPLSQSQSESVTPPLEPAKKSIGEAKQQESDMMVFPKKEEKKPAGEEKPKVKKETKTEPDRSNITEKKESPAADARSTQAEKTLPKPREEIKEPESETSTQTKRKEAIKEPVPQPIPVARTIKPGQIVAETELDSKPVAVSTPLPRISKRIRKTITGNQHMLVSILIDHNGNIEKVKLLKKSSLAEINSLIISTLAEWKYKPAVKDNIRVKTWKQIPISINKDKE
jgi:serine/threonine protein kinase/DNA-binding response OmpR family regulator